MVNVTDQLADVIHEKPVRFAPCRDRGADAVVRARSLREKHDQLSCMTVFVNLAGLSHHPLKGIRAETEVLLSTVEAAFGGRGSLVADEDTDHAADQKQADHHCEH